MAYLNELLTIDDLYPHRSNIKPWFEYRGYTIKRDCGGWAVGGTLFNTKEAAKDHIDSLPLPLAKYTGPIWRPRKRSK